MTDTRVDLLRHGETVGGARYRGAGDDDALSARGWEQMRAIVGDSGSWSHIVSSPLQRCAAFARELAQIHLLPLDIEPRLREIHFGDWEGKTAAEIHAACPDHLERFWNDPVNHPPPDGENFTAFQARVLGAWDDLLARHAGAHLLIVTHGGPIRVILGHARGLPWAEALCLSVPPASLHSQTVSAAIKHGVTRTVAEIRG